MAHDPATESASAPEPNPVRFGTFAGVYRPVVLTILVELPSLQKLEFQYFDTDDEQTTERTLAALAERGVTIVR